MWKGKISNIHQLGGIETSVLNNGPGRGTRIAWINTGSGLRFKVVFDRAMDILDAFYNQYSLAWISHMGVTSSYVLEPKESEWLSYFGGGLLTTCGLTHVGGPEEDEYGKRGMHGNISQVPAYIESVIQPDIKNELLMSITGCVTQSSLFEPHLDMRRTISTYLGSSVITIHDEITNRANIPVPHMLLYHFNFGWPLVDTGSKLRWEGRLHPRDAQSEKIFNSENDFKTCPPPINMHKRDGEAVAYIEVESDSKGFCTCGILNPKIGLNVTVTFRKSQLPWLTNWQHWGEDEYVTALEPGTHPPIGQKSARINKSLMTIEPGETKEYELQLTVDFSEKNEVLLY